MKLLKLLSGTNSKCAQCTEECKQYKEVIIYSCPNFRRKVSNKKIGGTSKHGKNVLIALEVSNFTGRG